MSHLLANLGLVRKLVATMVDADVAAATGYPLYKVTEARNLMGLAAFNPFTPPANVYLSNTDFSNGGVWLIRTGITSVTKNAADASGTPSAASTFLFSAGSSARTTLGADVGGNLYKHTGCFAKLVPSSAVTFIGVSFNNGTATDYSVFDLTGGTVALNHGTGTGTITSVGNGFYWCQVDSSANEVQDPTFTFGDTAAHAVPGVAWTAAGTETIIAYGPYAA